MMREKNLNTVNFILKRVILTYLISIHKLPNGQLFEQVVSAIRNEFFHDYWRVCNFGEIQDNNKNKIREIKKTLQDVLTQLEELK